MNNKKSLHKLVDQAREDPKFFHELVFNTVNVLKQIDYLDHEIRTTLERNSPEEVIAKICGVRPVVKIAQDDAP